MNNCFEQLPPLFSVRCAFWEPSEQRWYAVYEGVSFISVQGGVPLCSQRPLSPARLCRPSWFFQMEVVDNQEETGPQFFKLFGGNVQHRSEQVNRNDTEINLWPWLFVTTVASMVRNCAIAQYHHTICAVKSRFRALPTIQIKYCICISHSLSTLHWLCVCMVARLHVLSAQQNKHLLSVEFS